MQDLNPSCIYMRIINWYCTIDFWQDFFSSSIILKSIVSKIYVYTKSYFRILKVNDNRDSYECMENDAQSSHNYMHTQLKSILELMQQLFFIILLICGSFACLLTSFLSYILYGYENFIFNFLHVEGALRYLSLKTFSLNYHYDYRSYRYNIISAILVNKSFNHSICQKIGRTQNCTLYTIPKHYFMILSKHINLAVNQ